MLSIFLIAVSLAMDAFAVSVSSGMSTKHFAARDAVVTGIYFGAFQFLMPIAGWLLGQSISKYIEAYGHYVAFGLLAFIGVRMIGDSIKKASRPQEASAESVLTHWRLAVFGLATSIDALIVGVSMAFMDVNIFFSASVIGIVTFFLSVAGCLLGNRLGRLFQKRAEIIGGVVLILIGINILTGHMAG